MNTPLPDPVRAGLARGWKVRGGPYGPAPERLDCDVVIVGSGAGAGITAELLARAGLHVVIVEEGPLRSSSDFRQRESEAYASLYQEGAARKTADGAISILQGRCVGGSTVINWTSCARTPDPTLAFWQQRFALAGYDSAGLAPYFSQVEKRLNIAPWPIAPNENNDLLQRGAQRLGIRTQALARNVRGCSNLGSCGMGCPTNAKQSMLVTTLPAALDRGARLLVETRALRLELANGRARSLLCAPCKPNGDVETGRTIRIQARHYVLAAGAIHTPAILLRSQAPDPHGRLGARTFLHPTVLSVAVMDAPVQAWQGAPQSLYSDHYLHVSPIDGEIGFKLEVPSLHPLLYGSNAPGIGAEYLEHLRAFPHTHVQIALLRDGFHPEAAGGQVRLRADGSPVLDYRLTPFILEGARRAYLAMAELQFAAGARRVVPLHESAQPTTTWSQARAAIMELPMEPLRAKVATANVMGGCGFAGDARQGVVRPDGIHWQLENVSVHDGSLFPTSLGANPQLSIYGIANRLSQSLARRLAGRDVDLDA